jgi:hypothetical protein
LRASFCFNITDSTKDDRLITNIFGISYGITWLERKRNLCVTAGSILACPNADKEQDGDLDDNNWFTISAKLSMVQSESK